MPMSLKLIIFTGERKLTAVFADAVANLPLDWVLVSDQLLAERLIGQEGFDLLLADTTGS
jgi:hypothetical protein